MIELMEETANMLRGMCMDPRIPQDTKEALWSRVRKLDAATEAATDDACGADAEIERLKAEVAKSERRAITFGDIVHTQVLAMRAAYVDAKLNGSDAGMAWIENTLEGPGHLPDLAAAKKEGGAQCMFNREMAEHEAFRAAHPAP